MKDSISSGLIRAGANVNPNWKDSIMQTGFIYLASPYSHPDLSYRVSRYIAAREACIQLFKEKKAVYSPIVHWHPIATSAGPDFPTDYESFKVQNDAFIHACSEFIVLGIDGWMESKGVQAEIALAQSLSKPGAIWHMEYQRGEYLAKAIEELKANP
jgi:hypothetical protein